MFLNKETKGGIFGTLISAFGTGIQTNELLQKISLILTILGSIITIVMALSNWWKNAKKDDKITKDELKNGINIIQDGVEKVNQVIKKEDKEDKK